MEKYLDEVKAKRYLELLHREDVYSSIIETEDHKEFCALSDESIAKQIEIYGEPKHTPFEGRCRRCGREFSDPVPEMTYPEGIHEIACSEFCAGCNAFVMSIVFRECSAYRQKHLVDPLRGGSHAS